MVNKIFMLKMNYFSNKNIKMIKFINMMIILFILIN